MDNSYAEKDIKAIEDTVWNSILLKNIKGSDFSGLKSIPVEYGDRKFQVFEVLVAETLAMLDKKRIWTVTGVQGDGGIDFKGESEPQEIPGLLTFPKQLVLGQVKRRKTDFEPEDLMKDLHSIFNSFHYKLNHTNILAILYIVSTKNFNKASERIKNIMEKDVVFSSINRISEVMPIDGNEIFKYCALQRNKIISLLGKRFSQEKLLYLNKYLASLSIDIANLMSFSMDGKNYGDTGKSLIKEVTISLEIPYLTLRFKVNWEKDANEKNAVQIVHPTELICSTGLEISFSSENTYTLNVSFRCFSKGKISLGQLIFSTEAGDEIKRIDLGSVNLNYQFNPPFFEKPNRDTLEDARRLLEKAANDISILAVTGIGGAGKTYLCEEIVDIACNTGFHPISIGHSLSRVSHKQLIKELILKLSTTGKNHVVFMEDTINELKVTLGNFEQSWELSLRAYCEDMDDADYNIDIIMKCLFALILLRTKDRPLIIHIKDLHWGDKEEFLILNKLVTNIILNKRYFKHGVYFLFEGRNREALRIDEGYYSPEDWFNFLRSDFITEKELKHWSKDESADFLDILFEASINKNSTQTLKRDILYKDLTQKLLKWAQGNPMHLIEQIKLLLNRRVISINEQGLLTVNVKLPDNYSVPQDTAELIKLRIEYFRNRYPAAVDIIVFLASISKQISRDFFDFIVKKVDEKIRNIRGILSSMEFAKIPMGNEGYFEFYHENYYQTFLQEELSDTRLLPNLALEWYEKINNPLPKQILEQVKIHFLSDEIQYDKVLRLIELGLLKSSDDYINENFYRFLLRLPDNVMEKSKYRKYEAYFELAEILIRIGDWTEALKCLETIKGMKVLYNNDIQYAFILLRVGEEIANIKTDIQKVDEAIDEIDNVLVDIDYLISKDLDFLGLCAIRERAWNRKAVCHWFNGQIDEAVKWQWKSYISSKKRKDNFAIMRVLFEIGTLFLHRDPTFGVKQLEKALVLAGTIPNIHYQYAHIVEVQLLMGKLLNLCKSQKNCSMRDIENLKTEAVRFHEICMEQRSIYEASLCGIVCGVSFAVLKKYDEAKYWLKMAITTASSANLYDILWKAHLNLAQICITGSSIDESKANAAEALRILIEGLRIRDDLRLKRLALIRLPLLHILRIDDGFKDEISKLLGEDHLPAFSSKAWKHRPFFISRAREAQQVLHVRDNQNDYFLMN